MNNRRKLIVALGAGVFGFVHLAVAQPYPNKPVRMVVGFPPGGPVDIVARALAPRISELLGQTALIDNRAGAGGIVGADLVAKSAPDGYNLLIVPNTLAIHVSLYSKLPYDTLKDFIPIALLTASPLVLVVHPSVPATNLRQLIALAKARPGDLNYASPGSGTANHLSGEMLKSMAKIDVAHVPYKGGAPAEIDLLGGHVSFMFDTIPLALPNVRSGRLRALAVTWARRSPAAPDIPTLAESGLPGFDTGTWYGMVGPAGLPREIVMQLNTEINKVLQSTEFKQRMASLGVETMPGTPEQFGDFIKTEIVKWAKVVKESGARAD
jgi:tripartite-type tricarboxylate transporter receptor subunit TctC